MATRKITREEVDALAKQLGVTVDTRNMNETQLAELNASLRARQTPGTPAPGAGPRSAADAVNPTPGAARTADPARSNALDVIAGAPAVPLKTNVRTGDPGRGGPPPNAPITIDGADDGTMGGPPKPQGPQVEVRFPYQVAPDKSVSTSRGILGPGEEVKAADLVAVTNEQDQKIAQQRLDALVEQGVVLRQGAHQGAASSSGQASGGAPATVATSASSVTREAWDSMTAEERARYEAANKPHR